MKKSVFIFSSILFCLAAFSVKAQEEVEKKSNENEYRRSSLCLILIDESAMPKRDTIIKAFLDTPIPDKYNDHNVSNRIYNADKVTITEDDRAAYKAAKDRTAAAAVEQGKPAPKKKGGFGKFMKSAAGTALAVASGSESSTVVDTKDKEEYAIVAYKNLLEQRVAKELFDKWFIGEDGYFSMDLIHERGLYDASVLDVQKSKSSVYGKGLLEDAGEELINNTFVVVSRFRYMSKDELVKEMDGAIQSTASLFGSSELSAIGDVASLGAKVAMGEGYYVRITSFLFQLNWNADVSDVLYSELWDNPEAYNASDIFSLNYVGQESAFANVKAGIFTSKPESELIRIATINATDAVLAKLAKEYEVFQTKTPLRIEEDGTITAHIGMKEGLEGGEKFEVLEQLLDAETGKTTYKRKTTLKVAKGKVWDNRYMADEELEAQGKEQTLTATIFEGSSKGLYNGMLLRQIK